MVDQDTSKTVKAGGKTYFFDMDHVFTQPFVPGHLGDRLPTDLLIDELFIAGRVIQSRFPPRDPLDKRFAAGRALKPARTIAQPAPPVPDGEVAKQLRFSVLMHRQTDL